MKNPNRILARTPRCYRIRCDNNVGGEKPKSNTRDSAHSAIKVGGGGETDGYTVVSNYDSLRRFSSRPLCILRPNTSTQA